MLPQPPIWLILIAFICALGPLVFVHEFGHYYVARLLRIPAEAFSIGFGREVFGWTDKRGTRWKVGWIPLGGYVRFIGDMSPASEPTPVNDIPPELRDKTFQLRPLWQRFLVVLAGPAANFLSAILIFAAFFAFIGKPSTPSDVTQVMPGSAAARAGIEIGDKIVGVAGRSTSNFEEVANNVLIRPGEQVDIAIERSGRHLVLPVTLATEKQRDRFGQEFKIGRLGVLAEGRVYERPPVLKLIPEATIYTYLVTRGMIDVLAQIVTGRRSVKELGGPIRIAQVAGQQASVGALEFIQLLAFFSINLGFINLLPVPMLDGGHLAFYAAEAVRRRPLSARATEWAFRGGLALILALVLVTTFNDLGSIGLIDRLQRLIG